MSSDVALLEMSSVTVRLPKSKSLEVRRLASHLGVRPGHLHSMSLTFGARALSSYLLSLKREGRFVPGYRGKPYTASASEVDRLTLRILTSREQQLREASKDYDIKFSHFCSMSLVVGAMFFSGLRFDVAGVVSFCSFCGSPRTSPEPAYQGDYDRLSVSYPVDSKGNLIPLVSDPRSSYLREPVEKPFRNVLVSACSSCFSVGKQVLSQRNSSASFSEEEVISSHPDFPTTVSRLFSSTSLQSLFYSFRTCLMSQEFSQVPFRASFSFEKSFDYSDGSLVNGFASESFEPYGVYDPDKIPF